MDAGAIYSFVLKRFPLLDALALAGLYVLRIIAGAAAATVALSFWLLLFSLFLFLSFAFVKRHAELEALRRLQRLHATGRGYHIEDLPLLLCFGTGAGFLSVLVLALYINSPDIQALYHRPKAVWMLCVLLLCWIGRVWMTAHRGSMHDDPVIYALRDPVSLGLGVLAAITVIAAIQNLVVPLRASLEAGLRSSTPCSRFDRLSPADSVSSGAASLASLG